jgi:hypothetical protein
MTPIIRASKAVTSTRRRLNTARGVLPEEILPPPSTIFFRGEEADRQIQEHIEDPNQLPLEEEDMELFDEPGYEPEVVHTKKVTKAKKTGVNPIEDIMKAMREGEAVMIKCLGVNTYQVSVIPNDIIVSKTGFQYLKKGITGRQYWLEVLNPEFEEWSKKWNAMTYSEKLKYAKSKKIKWESVPDNPKLDVMRMSEAVRKAENIEKYKPEYMKRSARSKIRG